MKYMLQYNVEVVSGKGTSKTGNISGLKHLDFHFKEGDKTGNLRLVKVDGSDLPSELTTLAKGSLDPFVMETWLRYYYVYLNGKFFRKPANIIKRDETRRKK